MAITGADIVNSAMKYKGTPYFEGNPQGTPAEGKAGFDCSGIVQRALSDLGVSIPRTTDTQLAAAVAGTAGHVVGRDLNGAQQGDILQYTGHEEIWLNDGGNVFSEAVPGTVADVRPRTPWPIVGIVRYAGEAGGPVNAGGGGGSNAQGSITDLINSLPDIPFAPLKAILLPFAGALTGLIEFVKAVADFLHAITSPQFWARVAMGALGLILLVMGATGLAKRPQIIKVTSDMVRKGTSVASQS